MVELSPPQISFLFIFSIAKHWEKEPLYTLSGSQAVLAADVSRIHFGEVWLAQFSSLYS